MNSRSTPPPKRTSEVEQAYADEFKNLVKWQKALSMAEELYEQSKRDLGDMTIEKAYLMYKQDLISKEKFEELKNAIEILEMQIKMTPETISTLKQKVKESKNKLKNMKG